MSAFRVSHIDHVELYVADQYEAAAWYERVFGLQILQEFAFWAEEGGPLMVSSDEGYTKLALFRGDAAPDGQKPRFLVAFQVDGAGFIEFLGRLQTLDLTSRSGQPLSAADVVDHDKSWSVYFDDPYGNPFEITTYDYETVRQQLSSANR